MATKFNIFQFLFIAIPLAQISVARSPPEIDREAKLFLLNNPYLPYYAGVPVANSYSAPSPAGRTAAGARDSNNSNGSNNLGPFFGYFPNLLGKPCECPALPAACPATTKPADINIPTASSCNNAPATILACAKSTAAPSGTFTVTFNTASTPAMASLGIVTTCPNTQVKVTCGPFPAGVYVFTQTGALNNPPTAPTVTEIGEAHILVTSIVDVLAGSKVTCTWMAS